MTKHKKSLGQHFLKDPKILKKIADFARIEKDDMVVEVGPGEGGLTLELLDRAERVVAIEKDSNLVERLKEKFKSQITNYKFQIIEGDILEGEQKILERTSAAERSEARTSERQYFLRANLKNYVLVGNIPYYITGVLFRKIFESENLPKSATFVVQKEVADRIMGSHFAKTSRDKSRGKESILSISIKAYGTPEYGGIIKAGSFYPKPKVDSAVISIRDISRARFESQQKNISSLSTDISLLRNSSARLVSLRKARSESFSADQTFEKRFFEILKRGFAHKRKLLIKNLVEAPRGTLELGPVFKKCGIPENARAEDLSVDDWFCLTREIGVK